MHYRAGRLHQKLGQAPEALAAFNAALDLRPSPPDAALLKAALEQLRAPDAEREEY